MQRCIACALHRCFLQCCGVAFGCLLSSALAVGRRRAAVPAAPGCPRAGLSHSYSLLRSEQHRTTQRSADACQGAVLRCALQAVCMKSAPGHDTEAPLCEPCSVVQLQPPPALPVRLRRKPTAVLLPLHGDRTLRGFIPGCAGG